MLPFYRLAWQISAVLASTGFLSVKADNNIFVKYTNSTIRDIYTFADFCSFTRPFFRFTRVYEYRLPTGPNVLFSIMIMILRINTLISDNDAWLADYYEESLTGQRDDRV